MENLVVGVVFSIFLILGGVREKTPGWPWGFDHYSRVARFSSEAARLWYLVGIKEAVDYINQSECLGYFFPQNILQLILDGSASGEADFFRFIAHLDVEISIVAKSSVDLGRLACLNGYEGWVDDVVDSPKFSGFYRFIKYHLGLESANDFLNFFEGAGISEASVKRWSSGKACVSRKSAVGMERVLMQRNDLDCLKFGEYSYYGFGLFWMVSQRSNNIDAYLSICEEIIKKSKYSLPNILGQRSTHEWMLERYEVWKKIWTSGEGICKISPLPDDPFGFVRDSQVRRGARTSA